jgi:hypothetical protein
MSKPMVSRKRGFILLSDWFLAKFGGTIGVVLLGLLLFSRMLLNITHIGYDFEFYHFPLFAYVSEQLSQLDFPIIDRFAYCGQYFVTNTQAMIFYPAQALLALFNVIIGQSHSLWQYEIFYMLHYIFAAIGTYFVGRYLGGSVLVSIAASATLWFGGEMLGNLQHLGQGVSRAWFPWLVLVALHFFLKGHKTIYAILIVLIVAVVVSVGFLPEAAAFLLVTACVGPVLCLNGPGDWRRWLAGLALYESAIVLGVIISAPVWMPGLMLVEKFDAVNFESPRSVLSLASYITPNILFDFDPKRFIGTGDITSNYLFEGPILFIAFGAMLMNLRSAFGLPLLGICLFVFCYTLRIQPINALGHASDLLKVVRPAYFSFYASALVLCALPACKRLPSAAIAATGLYVLCWGLAGILLAHSSFNRGDWLRLGSISILLLVCTSMVGLVRRPVNVFPSVDIASIVIVTMLVAYHAFALQPIWFLGGPTGSVGKNWFDFDHEDVLRQLRQASGPYRVAVNQRYLGGPFNGSWRIWRIESINGFEPSLPESYAETIYPNFATWRTNRLFGDFLLDSSLAGDTNVLYYLTTVNDPMSIKPGWTIVYDNYFKIYRNDNFEPRFRLFGQACGIDTQVIPNRNTVNGWDVIVDNACPNSQLLVSEFADEAWRVVDNGHAIVTTKKLGHFGFSVGLVPGSNHLTLRLDPSSLFKAFRVMGIGLGLLLMFSWTSWQFRLKIQ